MLAFCNSCTSSLCIWLIRVANWSLMLSGFLVSFHCQLFLWGTKEKRFVEFCQRLGKVAVTLALCLNRHLHLLLCRYISLRFHLSWLLLLLFGLQNMVQALRVMHVPETMALLHIKLFFNNISRIVRFICSRRLTVLHLHPQHLVLDLLRFHLPLYLFISIQTICRVFWVPDGGL
uniref:Uncharacterized protein n=1 Tax=Arundo donax TaxID=35708 RepID=A0A0A8ZCR0_ARUDO